MNTWLQTPSEILDYRIDWCNTSRNLGTDVIITSSWAVSPAGLNTSPPAPSFTSNTTTVWLSGGTADTYYAVTNTITTAGGRELQETFIIHCVAQRLV